jgi:hypothetical protein
VAVPAALAIARGELTRVVAGPERKPEQTGHVLRESQTTEPIDGAAAVDSGLDGSAD